MVALLRNQLSQIVTYRYAHTYYTAQVADDRLLSLIGPSLSSFVDIGANVGNWSQAVLTRSPTICSGVLIEPSRSALLRLRARFGADTRLRILPVAVSSETGPQRFFEDPDGGEASTMIEAFRPPKAMELLVETSTLDALMEKIRRTEADFLKIDVRESRRSDGAAARCIRGVTPSSISLATV